jgi:hypothetical protein
VRRTVSLTAVSGMAAVTELVEYLGVIERLDAAISPIKVRRRGHTGGQLLVGLAGRAAGRRGLFGWTASAPIEPPERRDEDCPGLLILI